MIFEVGYTVLCMEDGQPSFTALTAAAARAAHLIVDQEPWIFADALAAPKPLPVRADTTPNGVKRQTIPRTNVNDKSDPCRRLRAS